MPSILVMYFHNNTLQKYHYKQGLVVHTTKKGEKWHLLPDLFHFFSSTFFLLRQRSHPDFTMNHHFPAQRLLLSVVGNFLVIRKRSTVFDFKYKKKIWVTLLTQFYLKRQSDLYFPQCTYVSGKGWENQIISKLGRNFSFLKNLNFVQKMIRKVEEKVRQIHSLRLGL